MRYTLLNARGQPDERGREFVAVGSEEFGGLLVLALRGQDPAEGVGETRQGAKHRADVERIDDGLARDAGGTRAAHVVGGRRAGAGLLEEREGGLELRADVGAAVV